MDEMDATEASYVALVMTTIGFDERSPIMKAITINPYTNVRKMNTRDFWTMVKAQQDRHDEYTYTLRSTATDFDVVYTTVYDEKRTTTLYAFCGDYLDSQLESDGVAIVLQHCEDFDTLLIIER